jgi:hypothetical protein
MENLRRDPWKLLRNNMTFSLTISSVQLIFCNSNFGIHTISILIRLQKNIIKECWYHQRTTNIKIWSTISNKSDSADKPQLQLQLSNICFDFHINPPSHRLTNPAGKVVIQREMKENMYIILTLVALIWKTEFNGSK